MAKEKDKEFTFLIKEHIGIIATYPTGWSKELNVVEWNGKPAKLDVRDWDPKHEHMSRGVTLHRDEANTMIKMIYSYLKHTEAPKEETANVDERPKDDQTVPLPKPSIKQDTTMMEGIASS